MYREMRVFTVSDYCIISWSIFTEIGLSQMGLQREWASQKNRSYISWSSSGNQCWTISRPHFFQANWTGPGRYIRQKILTCALLTSIAFECSVFDVLKTRHGFPTGSLHISRNSNNFLIHHYTTLHRFLQPLLRYDSHLQWKQPPCNVDSSKGGCFNLQSGLGYSPDFQQPALDWSTAKGPSAQLWIGNGFLAPCPGGHALLSWIIPYTKLVSTHY